eukprot:2311820-Prymnesium_polylepis.1
MAARLKRSSMSPSPSLPSSRTRMGRCAQWVGGGDARQARDRGPRHARRRPGRQARGRGCRCCALALAKTLGKLATEDLATHAVALAAKLERRTRVQAFALRWWRRSVDPGGHVSVKSRPRCSQRTPPLSSPSSRTRIEACVVRFACDDSRQAHAQGARDACRHPRRQARGICSTYAAHCT